MQGTGAAEFEDFLGSAGTGRGPESPSLSLRAWVDIAEAWRIREALAECRGNRTAAARLLGIGRRTLYAKMERLDIPPRGAP